MRGTDQLLDIVEIDVGTADDPLTVYINVADNSLSRKWLSALNHLVGYQYHLEKNFCWMGWAEGDRQGAYLIDQINASIGAINSADLGYYINNHYTLESSVDAQGGVAHDQFNLLHRYFEDLQGTAQAISPYYTQADATTRWHIRQLNLLCHEFESWQLSERKRLTAPEWQRPSQLMCWLQAPRFELDESDLDLFGIDTINRELGAVYVGVNKAVGKHHWEVFQDEGRDSRINELVTTSMRAQTLAAGDFDIEWANNPGAWPWQQQRLQEFREWLVANGFDPEDRLLTIGHPQVGQVDLLRTFGTKDYRRIWAALNTRLNVVSIRTSTAAADYPYRWTDADYQQQQITALKG